MQFYRRTNKRLLRLGLFAGHIKVSSVGICKCGLELGLAPYGKYCCMDVTRVNNVHDGVSYILGCNGFGSSVPVSANTVQGGYSRGETRKTWIEYIETIRQDVLLWWLPSLNLFISISCLLQQLPTYSTLAIIIRRT